jgi:signal transduction histidine kinase
MLEYSDKGKSAIVDINLSNLVIEIVELIKPSIPRDVQLNLECDQDVPMIRGDEGMISQVILNFLTNAVDAMQDRAGSICVRTGVRVCDREFLAELCPDDDLPEGPYVFAKITDEGVGFDEASREQLFNPFFTTKIEGRGLGLAAVQGIVQQHRGGIMFDSIKGEGSTFCVFLPILTPDRRQR